MLEPWCYFFFGGFCAGKATVKGGGKPQGTWASLKHGWQNKAVAMCGAALLQQRPVFYAKEPSGYSLKSLRGISNGAVGL